MSGLRRARCYLLALFLVVVVIAAIRAFTDQRPPLPPPGRQPSRPAEPPPEEVRLPPEEPTAGVTAVRYRCLLPDGVPPDAPVSAWWTEDPERGAESYPVTLDEGVLTVEVPAGSGQVSFHVRGCAVVEYDIDVEDGRVLDGGEVVLRLCTPLTGRVVDADGKPIRRAFLYPEVDGHSVPLTSTARDGTFEFDGLPDGEATLRVDRDGYVRQTVRFRLSAETGPLEIVLYRGGRVHGRVFDESGQPQPDAYLWIVDPEDEENRDRMAWPSVEDDGSFSVHLSAGRYVLNGLAGDLSGSSSIQVSEGGSCEVTLRLTDR